MKKITKKIVQKKFYSKPFEAIPSPKELPFFGSFFRFLKSKGQTHELFQHLSKQHGPIIKLKIFNKYVVLLSDPEEIKKVYTLHQTNAQRGDIPGFSLHRNARGLPYDLVLATGDSWLRQRKVINKLLQPKIVDEFVEGVDKVARDFVKYVERNLTEAGHLPDIRESSMQYGLEAISQVLNGQPFNILSEQGPTEKHKFFIKSVNNMMESIDELQNDILSLYFETKAKKKNFEAWDNIFKIGGEFSKNATEKGFLNYTIDADVTDQERIMIQSSFFAGGVDTTAVTMLNGLYSLAVNPEAQEKIYEEVMSVIGDDTETPITPQKLKEMEKLKKGLDEALRLHPTVLGSARLFEEDVEVMGYRIPKGTPITLSLYGTTKNPEIFSNPEKFDIERKERHPSASVFGAGARQCPGKRIALAEIHLAIARLLQKYRLEAKKYPNLVMKSLIHPFPDNDSLLYFRKRK